MKIDLNLKNKLAYIWLPLLIGCGESQEPPAKAIEAKAANIAPVVQPTKAQVKREKMAILAASEVCSENPNDLLNEVNTMTAALREKEDIDVTSVEVLEALSAILAPSVYSTGGVEPCTVVLGAYFSARLGDTKMNHSQTVAGARNLMLTMLRLSKGK
jgi:hypothetical protein